jgi:hypothetical protein
VFELNKKSPSLQKSRKKPNLLPAKIIIMSQKFLLENLETGTS